MLLLAYYSTDISLKIKLYLHINHKHCWLLCPYFQYHPRCEATETDPDADCIFGSAGSDYPILAQVPRTKFSCQSLLPGIYADPDAACQVGATVYADPDAACQVGATVYTDPDAACLVGATIQGRLTINNRYTHSEFELTFSSLLKDYDLKYAENSKK